MSCADIARKRHLRRAARIDTREPMPSAPRDLAPGLHHIWVGATGNESYFLDGDDRITWLRHLVSTVRLFDWTCVAFCQMTTHVHLVVDVPDESLAVGMKRLNMRYSRNFNDRHNRPGQFIRRRYGSRRIEDGRDLVGVFVYVVANPVTAGICDDAVNWRWSSYTTTVGITSDFPFVDASLVIAEAGGTVERLQRIVNSRERRNWPQRTWPVSDTGRVPSGQVRL
jgi:putative transposase